MAAFTEFPTPLKAGTDASSPVRRRRSPDWMIWTALVVFLRDGSCAAASRCITRQGRPFGRRARLSVEQADRQQRHQRQERKDSAPSMT